MTTRPIPLLSAIASNRWYQASFVGRVTGSAASGSPRTKVWV